MTYFKVCDTFYSHPKTEEASDAAVALWVKAGSWCGQQLSDGRVPAKRAHNMGSVEAAQELVDLEMWHAPGHDCVECPSISRGYVFHDWTEHNRTRAEVEQERQKWRLKKAGQRALKADTEAESSVSPGDSPLDAPWDSLGESPKSPGMEAGDFDFALTATTHLPCEHGEIRGEWACALCRAQARSAS